MAILPPASTPPTTTQQLLGPFATVVRFPRDRIIWHRGDPSSPVLFLCCGAAKIEHLLGDGTTFTMGLIGRHDLVGEVEVVTGNPSPITLTALDQIKALQVEREALRQLMEEDPLVCRLIMESLANKVDHARRQADLTIRDAVEIRLARLLLDMGARFAVPNDARGQFVALRLARRDYATMVCSREETVIRVFADWTRKDWLISQKEGIVITHAGIKALTQLLPETPAS